MTEETQTPDFSNRPPLDMHPQQMDPNADYAKKDSKFNQDVNQCAQWLRDNKDKAGTDEYVQNLNALQSLADKNYPMAQLRYAEFLRDNGELNQAGIYFEKAQQNENAGAEIKTEINTAVSDYQKQQQEQGKKGLRDKFASESDPPEDMSQKTEEKKQWIEEARKGKAASQKAEDSQKDVASQEQRLHYAIEHARERQVQGRN